MIYQINTSKIGAVNQNEYSYVGKKEDHNKWQRETDSKSKYTGFGVAENQRTKKLEKFFKLQ